MNEIMNLSRVYSPWFFHFGNSSQTNDDEPQQSDILNGEKRILKTFRKQVTHVKQPNTQPTHQ